MSNAEDRSSSFNKDTCPLSRHKRISIADTEVMSQYYDEAGMRIEDCYDLNYLQVAGEQLFF